MSKTQPSTDEIILVSRSTEPPMKNVLLSITPDIPPACIVLSHEAHGYRPKYLISRFLKIK